MRTAKMRTAMTRTAQAPKTRPGFTLIELLVVIAIIGVLAALTVAGIFTTVEGQRQNNTETNMRTVMKTLEAHWAHVVTEAGKESPSLAAKLLAGGTLANQGDDADLQRAKAIWIKLRLMEAFPVSYSEVVDPAGPKVYQAPPWMAAIPVALLPAVDRPWIPVKHKRFNMASYQRILKGKTAASNRLTEQSACLLMALSIPRGGNKLETDTLGSSAVRDTDDDGVPEIVDNWGRPFAFFRFPTANNLELQALGPTSARSLDPIDPYGKLLVTGVAWFNRPLPFPPSAPVTTCGAAFNQMFHLLNPGGNPPRRSHYIVPVLVSAGRDGRFGLDQLNVPAPLPNAMNVTTPVNDNDNIYSFRLRLGARGD